MKRANRDSRKRALAAALTVLGVSVGVNVQQVLAAPGVELALDAVKGRTDGATATVAPEFESIKGDVLPPRVQPAPSRLPSVQSKDVPAPAPLDSSQSKIAPVPSGTTLQKAPPPRG